MLYGDGSTTVVIEDGEVALQPSPNRFEVLEDDESLDSSIPSEGEEHLFTDHILKQLMINNSVRLTCSMNRAYNQGDDKKKEAQPPNKGKGCGRPKGQNRWR